MTPEEWLKSNMVVYEEKIDSQKYKVVRYVDKGLSKYLDINATDEEIEAAKDELVEEILYAYDVVEEEGIGYVLKLKEEFE